MTNPTEPICTCGHSKHSHGAKAYECFSADCDCDEYRPAPAHDTLAPQLRERIATLEQELAEAKRTVSMQMDELNRLQAEIANWMGRDLDLRAENSRLDNEVEGIRERYREAIRDRDMARDHLERNAKTQLEEFNRARNLVDTTSIYVLPAIGNLQSELRQSRAESADLRATVAALHPYADMAAGLLAEKVNADEKFQEVMDEALKHRDEWPTMKPRPEAEGREG